MAPVRLTTPRLSFDLPPSRDEAVHMAETGNFGVQRAQHLLYASQHAVDLARAALGPKVSLQGQLSRARDTQVQRL